MSEVLVGSFMKLTVLEKKNIEKIGGIGCNSAVRVIGSGTSDDFGRFVSNVLYLI